MFQSVALSIIILLVCGLALAQSPPDTIKLPADTIFVIPAGPVAGTFTPAARLSITDTVAGWAKIQVEGWVPIRAVADRMREEAPPPAQVNRKAPADESGGNEVIPEEPAPEESTGDEVPPDEAAPPDEVAPDESESTDQSEYSADENPPTDEQQ